MANTVNPGNAFAGNKYVDGIVLLNQSAANTALALHAPVAAGADTEAVDKNVLAIAGTMRMGCGDAAYLYFAKSGTIMAGTLFISAWRPIIGVNGLIMGYMEFPLCDVASAFTTFGSVAIGTTFTGVGMLSTTGDLTSPTTAIVGTEVWASVVTITVNGNNVDNTTISNNIDIIKTADDGPTEVRITPFDGLTHIRVSMKNSGGGNINAFINRGRGLGLNAFH